MPRPPRPALPSPPRPLRGPGLRPLLRRGLAAALLPAAALAAAGEALPPASCSSDGRAQPVALLERFVSADCESCWSGRGAPRPRPGELALDWVAPSARGDDAPLSVAALPEARERLERLGRPGPAPEDSVRSAVARTALRVRVAHGLPLAEYLGASIAMQPAGAGPWQAWLLMVESVPAGTDGSAVARRLVRAVFRPGWDAAEPQGAAPAARREARAMRIPEGARPSRLAVVGWVEDAQGRIVAAAQSSCAPLRRKR